MLRRILFITQFLLFLTGIGYAQNYNMSSGTINSCTGNFYDSGGGAGNYANSENSTMTICSGVAGQCVRLVFTSFDLETGFDFLSIYDGPTTGSPLIGTFTGNTGPGLITSSSGCLTIRFTSDAVFTYTGWSAQISCVTCATGVCPTTCNGGPPPANDACTGATNLGLLPIPSACPGGIGALATLNTTNLCATAPSPYTSMLGCQPAGNMASPAADVWYRFDITGPSLNVNISGGLANPNVGLYEGSSCANLIARGCAIGSNGSLNTTFGGLAAGTYYLQVSGGSLADQCDFSLTLQNNYDCAGCVIQSNFTANPPPVNGTYNAGQTVNFCFTISDYNQTSANWLHGVIPTFGPGWDMSTFTPISATNCSGQGSWNWYNTNVTSSATGTVTGPGFYYESALGNINGVTDANPGNNFGDNNAANSCDWTFCWSVKTLPIGSCIQGASLNVSVNTTGDGESGSWTSLACTQDAVNNFFATLTCCQAPVISSTNTTCPNSTNGTATAQGQGTGPFDYVWMNSVGLVLLTQNNIAGSSTISNLAAGTYTVQVTDNNGCTSNAAVTINSPAAFTSNMTTTPSTCNGSNNGTASVLVSGGTGGYTYVWSPAGAGSNPTGLAAGNYTVTVTDNRGCTTTATGTITQPAALVLSTTSTTNATCSNSNNGSISVTANGGTPGYTYAWNTGATGATLNNITGGAYTVTVTDSKGCTAFMTVAISAPSALVLNMSSTASSCGNANGTATVSVLGGSPAYTYQWSPSGGTNSSASGLVAGGYNVTVTDNHGCTAIGNVVVSNSSGPTASISASANVSCNGGNNGSATVSVAGGTAPISYAWSPSGGNGTTASGLSAGNYTVVVTDGAGCTSAASVVISEPTPVAVNITATTDATCNGGANGSLTASASNGTPGYTYAWSSGGNTATVNGLSAGTYTVTATDANGCTALTTGTVNEPTPVTVSVSATTDALCNGSSDGTATAAGNGGTPGYTYLWSNGNNTASASGLAAGTYTVTVTDANGCTSITTATVSEPTPIQLNLSSVNSTCGNADGSVSVVANGGTPGYTYTWNPVGGNSANANGVAAGGYTVVVTDANGCTATGSVSVADTPGPVVSLNTVTDVSCPGGGDGTIDVSIAGGTAPYTYSWSGGGNTNPATGLSAGTYTVTVTDDNGCTSTLSAAVNEPPVITLAPAVNTAHCGLADGSGDFTAGGGTPGYTYLWSDGSTNQQIQNVTAGTYTMTVTDANGCTASASLAIPDDPPPVIVVSASTDASCSGGADGTITVSVNGGVTPYSIAWSSGASGTTATGLAAGTYTATVTDASGCTATIQGTVSEPSLMQLQLSATSATCGTANGSATVVANGGTPGYTYNWIPSGGNAATANNLTSGGYTVEVTDANGCTMQDVIAVPSANGPSASVLQSTDVSCNGGADGTLTIDVTGGTAPLNYQWSAGGSGTSGSGLTAGTYTVTVTDANGCSSTVTAIINEPPLLTVSGTPYTAHCGQADGSADITAAGGSPVYSYAWSTGTSSTQNLTGVATGSYTATVTDANGCTAEVTLAVADAPGPVVSLNTTTDVSCNGGADGSIDVGVAGGTSPYSYVWSNGGNTATNSGLAAGTYTVTVTDVFGCTSTLSATINEPTPLQLSFSSTDATCGNANGTATVTANGGTPGYSYLWDSGDVTSTAGSLTPGAWSVTVTDANGCTSQGSIAVSNANSPVASVLQSTDVSCNGGADGTLTIDVTGGTAPMSYQWSAGGSGTSGSGLTAGTYTVTVTDANGCTAVISATINEPVQLTLNGNANTAHCGQADGSVSIAAAGGTAPYSYAWSAGGSVTTSLSGLAAGSYTATVTDAHGCTASVTIAVPDAPGPVVSLNTAQDVSCNGGADGSIDVGVAGGTAPYSYSWSNGWMGATNSNLSAGTYTVTVTDVFGCTSTLAVTINEPAPLQLSFSHTDATCGGNNGTATVNVVGGIAPYNYVWDSGDVTATATSLAAGTYTVTVTDANGCTANGSTSVSDLSAPVLSQGVITTPACNGAAGGSAEVIINSGNGPYSYSWSPSGGNAAQATGLTAGNYTVTVTDANGCTSALVFVIGEPTALVVNNLTTPVNCFGGTDGTATIDAQGGTPAYTFDWNPGGIQSAARINLSAGTYTVTVTDANGCSAITQAVVTEPTDLTTAMNATDATCNGGNDGQATTLAAGGSAPYTYQWSTGGLNSTVNAVSAGTYTVTVTDNHGCTHQDQVTVGEAPAIVLNTSSTDATCGSTNGTAQVNGAGGTGALSYLWSNGDVGTSATGLGAGVYTVTATDGNGCTVSTTAAVSNLGGPVVNLQSVSDASCFAVADGSAAVNVTSGNGPFTYTWSPAGGNGSTANGLAAGNYSVDVTDVNGCTSTVAVVVQEPASLVPVTFASQETCNSANGTASVNVNGGTPPYSYLWTSGAVTSNASGLAAGTYTVTITDAHGCSTGVSAVVAAVLPPTLTSSVNDVTCNGGSNGAASVQVNNGTAPYSYQWSSGAVNANANNLSAGNYTCTVTDGNGCTTSQTVTIQAPAAINIQITPTDATCGQNNGSLSALANGGTGALSYLWSGGQNTALVSGLAAGSYTVTVTDGNGCTQTMPGAVGNLGGPVAVLQAQTDVSCNGGSDGSASVTVSAGNGPFIYSWTPSGGNAASASGLTAGAYVVNITDNNGCQSSVNVQINEPTAINLSASSNPASCGNANGSASVLANGGTGVYAYLWSNGTATASANNLVAGNYSVTVTDANGCSNSVSIAVTQPSSLSVTTASTDVTCYNGNDGGASVSVSGGSAPYSYLWSNGNITASVNNLSAGNYTATVTDGTGCSFVSQFSIQQAGQILIQVTPTDATCGQANGSLSAAGNGGTGVLSYLWSTGQNVSSISNLSAGTYTVTVTDANGCTGVLPAAVSNLGGPVAALQTQADVSCNGGTDGSASVNVSAGNGPFTYAWSPSGGNTASASGLTAGAYVVNITDNNGCQSVVNVQINEPSALNLAVNSSQASCGNANGSASVIANGGTGAYQYLWSSGGTNATASGLVAGNYSVTVTDANGCSANAAVSVTQPSSLNVTTSSTNVSCYNGNDGAAAVNVSGGSAPYIYLWNTGAATSALNNISAGAYTATVTDGTGCSFVSHFTIQQAAQIGIQVASVDATCGQSNGSLSAVANGGTGALSYTWSSGQNVSSVSNLAAGTYTVTVTDANGCTESMPAAIGNLGGPVAALQAQTDVSCNGGTDGSASVNVSAGNGPFTYAWSPSGGNAASASGLSAGPYVVNITDNNGCQSVVNVQINEPSALSLAVSSSQASCGNANGSVSVVANGGTGAYQYLWSSGGTNAIEGSLLAGNYTVTVTDANGCSAASSVQVTQPSSLSVTPASTDVLCNGGNDGTASVSVSGGSTPYTYLWNNGAVTSVQNNLTAGMYTATVTDATGCSYQSNFNITEPAAIQIQFAVTDASCGGSNGSAQANITGGTGTFSWSWSGGQSTQNITGMAAGSYTVTVTDGSGCTTAAVASIANLGGPQLSIAASSDVSCFGGSDGSASVVVNAGNGPYTYLWSTPNGSGTSASGLFPGSYTVTVTDNNGCISQQTVTISEPSAISVTLTPQMATCGQPNGVISATASGGTGTYNYTWSNGSPGNSQATQLAAGTYTVTVSDVNGCTVSSGATITNTAGPVVAVNNVTGVSCYGAGDGTAGVAVISGSGPYAYSWQPSGGNGASASGLAGGNYTVVITDINGCTAQQGIIIQEPAALLLQVNASPANCNAANGSAYVQSLGGTPSYSYQWNNGQSLATASALYAGNYTVTVTDAHGCTAVTSTQIAGLPGPGINNVSTTDVSCYGAASGTAQVSVSNGSAPYNYNWSSGDTTAAVSGLSAGSYMITVTDAYGCADQKGFSIQQPGPLNLQSSPVSMVNCYGGSDGIAEAVVSGGVGPYAYQWSNGDLNVQALQLSAGTYTVTITDANGCTTTSSTTITQPADLVVTNTAAVNASCYGVADGSASFNAGGGVAPYQYLWSNGVISSSASALSAGTYSVTVTDQHGCTEVSSVTITQPVQIAVSTAYVTPVSCFGGNNGVAAVNAAGGSAPYTYQWSTGTSGNTASGLPAGIYTVTVTDDNGCIQLSSVSVTQPALLQLQSMVNPVLCFGQSNASIQVSPNGGVIPYSYSWNTGAVSASLAAIPAGTYSVTVTDANNCKADTTFIISQPPVLTAAVINPDTICIGQTASLTVNAAGGTPAYSYLWNNGQSGSPLAVSPAVSSTFTVIVTDAHGCTKMVSNIAVPVFPALNITVAVDKDTICEGETVHLTTSASGGNGGPYTYSWTPAQLTGTGFSAQPDTTTLYQVTLSDGCTVLEPMAVTQVLVHPLPEVVFNPMDTAGCVPLTVPFQFTGVTTANAQYQWQFGDQLTAVGANPSHIYMKDGTFDVTLTVTDKYGCTDSHTEEAAVTVYPLPVAFYNTQPQYLSILHPEVQFLNESEGASISHWDFLTQGYTTDDWNPVYTFSDTGRFWVQLVVISNEGCVDTFLNEVVLHDEVSFYVPNAFSPNSDGRNEGFTGYGVGIERAEFFIFDRWGKMIYKSDALNKPWNGTYWNNGDPCPEGTYVYLFRVHHGEPEPTEYKGRVSLVR
ncbi:MAG: gliding motility-associated C-terminal domain-containing protein [Bacteroidia bacterium]